MKKLIIAALSLGLVFSGAGPVSATQICTPAVPPLVPEICIEVPPIDVPPIDVPPIGVPPILPPIDIPPIDVPPIVVPPILPPDGSGNPPVPPPAEQPTSPNIELPAGTPRDTGTLEPAPVQAPAPTERELGERIAELSFPFAVFALFLALLFGASQLYKFVATRRENKKVGRHSVKRIPEIDLTRSSVDS